MLASGLVRVGPTIGRGADTAALLERLRRTYDADTTLAALARTTGSDR
jgi:hypothetical protein